jgi:putative ABC transport system permease protein
MTIQVATLTLDFSLTNLARMAFSSGGQALPFARENHSFTIVGVAGRMGFMGPLPLQSDVLIPPGAAARMRKLSLTSVWDLFAPPASPASYSTVSVRVRSPQDVPTVKEQIEAMGFGTFALMDQLREMRIGFLIMDMFLIAVGMIGITVASLGIVNTMVMSILERYREIGIMKAVGATDGDVQRIFLFESGAIGLLGGTIGLGLGWVVSTVINAVINMLMARHGAPHMDYFNFPWWLCLGAIIFSILVSLLAGIYPTRRAARVDPVVALRHD